jgi:hypothetical protein
MADDYSYWRERAEEHLRAAEGSTPERASVLQALAAAYLKAVESCEPPQVSAPKYARERPVPKVTIRKRLQSPKKLEEDHSFATATGT